MIIDYSRRSYFEANQRERMKKGRKEAASRVVWFCSTRSKEQKGNAAMSMCVGDRQQFVVGRPEAVSMSAVHCAQTPTNETNVENETTRTRNTTGLVAFCLFQRTIVCMYSVVVLRSRVVVLSCCVQYL